MRLDHGDVVMDGHRLFDHIIIDVDINEEESVPPEYLLCRARVVLDTISKTGRVEVITNTFRFGDISGFEKAKRVKRKLETIDPRLSVYTIGYLLLLYLQRNGGVRVEFVLETGRVEKLVIQLDSFAIEGRLPAQFNAWSYFGETSKLED